MGKRKFNGDTKTGKRLQKKADAKREREEIAAYLALQLDGLTDVQKQWKLRDLAEAYNHE